MKRIKRWIKKKLMNFLTIDELTQLLGEQVRLFNRYIDKNNEMFKEQTNTMYTLNNNTRNSLNTKISHFQESVNVLHNTVENIVHIGTDVEIPECGHSWAVICVEGKMNLVKFVDLNGQDYRDITYFLKRYEGGKHCIDAPFGTMFDNHLFKF